MFKRITKCPACKAKVQPEWNFCGCGATLKDVQRVCDRCHRVVEADATNCVHCGRGFEGVEPTHVLLRWDRRPGEFARRIAVGDLAGALEGGAIVDQGTRALLLVDGALRHELPPGWKGTTQDPLSVFAGDEYAHRIELVAIEAGDTDLHWVLPGVTSDHFQVSVHVGIRVSLADAASLAVQLLKGREALTYGDLESWLEAELTAFVTAMTVGRSSEDLQLPSDELLRGVEVDLRAKLERQLERAGLRLIDLRELRVESPRLRELMEDRERGSVIARKSAQTLERLEKIEQLQDALLRKRKLDDGLRKRLEESRILTDAEIASLEAGVARDQSDEAFAWQQTRDVLAAKHAAALRRIGEEASLELFASRSEVEADLKERDREHKAKIARDMMAAKHAAAHDWVDKVQGMSPEEILVLGSAFFPDASAALQAKYQGASAAEQQEIRSDLEAQLLAVAKEGQDRAFRLAEGALGQASRNTCGSCGVSNSSGQSFCGGCGEAL